MRKPSSASAKIHWFESQKAMESLKKTVGRQMKPRYPEIDQVLLIRLPPTWRSRSRQRR